MKQSTSLPKLAFTVEEVGEVIGLSRAQIYRLIDQGELETIKIGKCRRITSAQLNSFLRSLEQMDKSHYNFPGKA